MRTQRKALNHQILSVLVVIIGIIGIAIPVSGQNYMRLDASFYSPVLDEIKMIDIYLPKDYFITTDVDYPVIYYLHGAGGDQNEGLYCAGTYYGNHYSDTSITSPAAIVVCPDGSCPPYAGSMWLNSLLYGNYEDYVIQDVIPFIESNFRVIPDKNFRFLHGVSMGGFGSGYFALRYPEMFRAACPSSGYFCAADTLLDTWRQALLDENGSFHLNYNAGNWTKLYFTSCGGFAPNLDIEPDHFESLFDTLGNRVDSVLAKWKNFNLTDMVRNLQPQDNLAFFLVCGTVDEFIFYPTNLLFADSLEKYGIDHDMAWYNMGHGVYEPVTHKKMFTWLDSLIEQSYIHMAAPELRTQNPELKTLLFPNPATSHLTVQFMLDGPATVEIAVLNQLGQQVQTVAGEKRPAGLQTLHIDVSGLPAGLYYLHTSVIGNRQSAIGNAIVKFIKQ